MHFRGYRVDAVHRTVTGPGGRVVRLEPKAFDLLLYFAAHPEETLSKDQLIADVWGGKFVTEDAVMVAVYALRQAFDDDSRSPRFVETIRGRGYRWIAKETAAAEAPRRDRTRMWLAAAWGLLIAGGFAVLVMAVMRPPQPMPSLSRTNELLRAHARGLFFSERTTRQDLEEARAEFRKAIAVDGRFAEPHAALAEVCVRLIEIGAPDAQANEAEARRELARALELGPGLAFTQAARASVLFVLDRDLQQAERTFRQAIELDPSLPDTHRRYSYLLSAAGRFVEAIEQARITADMQPASASAIRNLAWTHILAGQADEAERLYRDALRLEPDSPDSLASLGYCLELRNAPGAAMQLYRRAMQRRGVPEEAVAQYDRLFASSGLPGVYAELLERFKTNRDTPRSGLAFYAARAGRTSEALAFLREAAQRREPGTLWLAVNPGFASLRGQREFTLLAASSFHTR